MNHTVITIDIATPGLWDSREFRGALDRLLADWPTEFEDWKIHHHTEDRWI